jgi:CheY-like chemotaxis protein
MSRILVIDDEAAVRNLLRCILERAGHAVIDAPDGRQGLALLRRDSVDLVVTDIYMPEMDGIEVLCRMKHLAERPKIITISGASPHGMVDLNKAARLLGADKVLMKPFDQHTFLLAVNEVIELKVEDVTAPVQEMEQRKHPRFPVSFPVSFGDGASMQAGTVLDISREGCRIRCADVSSPPRYFQLKVLFHESDDSLDVDLAVMRWLKQGDIGVEFIRMTPENQARLRGMIKNCEKESERSNNPKHPRGTPTVISETQHEARP